jgi:biopolymer transport protein ExbB/TolQ
MRTIVTWYQTGGPYMIPLLAVGVAGLLILADRFTHLVLRTKINSRPFIERVISLVRAGKVDEALKLCAEHQSALPDLGLVILRSRSENELELLKVAEAATLTMVPALKRRLAWLPVLATIAILLGVLGGVANLHDALTQLAQSTADARGQVLLAIAYALRPVGAGVLTAIPLFAGHAFLLHESQNIVGQLEEFSARLVNALIDRPDVRLGHR